MELKYISAAITWLIIFAHFITPSSSKSVVKNLPGFDGDLPFTLETGYVGVGEHEDVELFYYFAESLRNPSEDPLFLYLDGGPGVSGLVSFLHLNIGPFSVNIENSRKNNITLDLNPYSWTKMANVIFVDIPAGVGFSYAKTWEASKSSDSILALQAYDFIRKWLMEHPRFLNNPLYISGISYIGIVLPSVVLEIYNGNEAGKHPMLNIKGYIMDCPLTDKFADFNSRLEFAHRLALISDDIYESAIEGCHGNYVYTDSSNILCTHSLQRMNECIEDINTANTLEPFCSNINPEPNCLENSLAFVDIWANNKDVQKALNIREGTIEMYTHSNTTISYHLGREDKFCYSYDVFSSVEYQRQLTNKTCRVLIMSGDHDMDFPYVGVQECIKSLDIPIASPWKPWFLRSQVAGYQTTYTRNGYSLKHATVKGSGHGVARWKPEESLFMLNEWLDSHTYSSYF